MIVDVFAEFRGEALALEQIANPQRATRDLILIGRPDPAPRRTDRIGALGKFSCAIERDMRGEDQRTHRADLQALEHRNALPDQHLGFLEQRLQRQHDAVADQALHPGMQDPRGNQRQHGFLAADDERMAGIVATLEAHHCLRGVGQQIDDLAFALIAPLQADDNDIFTHCAPPTTIPDLR